MRSKKEINEKISELYTLMQDGKIDVLKTIVYTDALCWVLGEDYLNEYVTDYKKLYEIKKSENDLLYRTIKQIYTELKLLQLKDCPEEEFHNIPLELCQWIEKLMKIRKETEIGKDGVH